MLQDALVDAIATYNEILRGGAEQPGFALIDAAAMFSAHGCGDDDPELADPLAADPPHWFADRMPSNARGRHKLRSLFLRALRNPGGYPVS